MRRYTPDILQPTTLDPVLCPSYIHTCFFFVLFRVARPGAFFPFLSFPRPLAFLRAPLWLPCIHPPPRPARSRLSVPGHLAPSSSSSSSRASLHKPPHRDTRATGQNTKWQGSTLARPPWAGKPSISSADSELLPLGEFLHKVRFHSAAGGGRARRARV